MASKLVVIAGLDPAIHSVAVQNWFHVTEWMPWSSHGMTIVLSCGAREGPE
jgi:hypothetical protein